jgi:hypothetical protein
MVYAKIMERGASYILASGPRIAGLMLRKVSTDAGIWDGPEGVERTLLAEIRRLTNILVPGERGWEMLPFDDARTRKQIEVEEAEEIEAAVIFFTAFSRMLPRGQKELLDGAVSMFGARIESSTCTEFTRSLPISNSAANTGAKAVA